MHRGDVIADRFEIGPQAGWGGMGVVYRALDRATGESVALKVLRGTKDDDARRFAREIQVLAELRHPSVVRYIAHGTTPAGEAFLAMEWLEGEDLADRLEQQTLSVSDSVAVIARAADALGVAHARGVLHRDVKPSNLFLVGRDIERVKLLDFGVARMDARTQTTSGLTVGTPAYMAPEQARGSTTIDARADVFALGCVLFECLTGRAAFQGDHLLTILSKVLLEEVPRASELRPEVPRALDDLVARMLAKAPERRPKDGSAVAGELAKLLAATTEAGAPSSRAVGPRSLTGGEQRLVSLVIAAPPRAHDELAQTLTPAQARDAWKPLREALSPYGANVEPLADGSVVATIAGAGVATDQAAKAARCALVVRAQLTDARVVLATGRAVLSDVMPVGEVIERAVSLLRADREGDGVGPFSGVRVDDVTAALLDDRFQLAEGAGARRVVGVRDWVDSPRTVLGRATPCVGRESELGALLAAFDECVTESVARAALVLAPAGIGKSRLRAELVQRLKAKQPELEVLVGRGDSVQAGAPFAVLALALRRAAGFHEGEPPLVRRTKLAAFVGRHVPETQRVRVAEFLGEIAGAPFDDEESPPLRAARQDPRLMNDQVHRAFEGLLEAVCRERPVLVVLEDLHWGDRPSVELVDGALRKLRDAPFMVLALARPELKHLLPDLWRERQLLEMNLSPLGRKACERLAREILGASAAEADVARIVERASGNPFYLEESIRAVAAGRTDALPETVLAMVQGRLESLESGARRVLRAASIFGEVFWVGAIEALLRGGMGARDVRGLLDQLAEREVVAKKGEGDPRRGSEYAFRHALLREAAYGMLTADDKRLGHRLAAEWLEGVGEAQASVLADHYQRGQDRLRAADCYRRAAERALEANDLRAALAHAAHAVECGAVGGELGAVRLVQAEAHRWLGEFEEAAASGIEAMNLLPRGTAAWCTAAAEVATAHNRRGRHDALQGVADTLAAADVPPDDRGAHIVAVARVSMHLLTAGLYEPARALAQKAWSLIAAGGRIDSAVAARLNAMRALQASFDSDLGLYRSSTEAAIRDYAAVGDVRAACLQRVNLGDALRKMRLYEAAAPVLSDALMDARSMGLDYLAALASYHLAEVRSHGGDPEGARRLLDEAVAAFTSLGDRRWEGAARVQRALLYAERGALAEAETEARTAADILTVAPPLCAQALAARAKVALLRGHVAEGVQVARQAMELLETLGKIEEGEAFVRSVYAQALAAAAEAV